VLGEECSPEEAMLTAAVIARAGLQNSAGVCARTMLIKAGEQKRTDEKCLLGEKKSRINAEYW
jgi:hypothetical protein